MSSTATAESRPGEVATVRALLVGGIGARRESLANLLRARGYEVWEAATPLDAIVRLQDESAPPLDSVVIVGAAASSSKAEIAELVSESFPEVRLVVT